MIKTKGIAAIFLLTALFNMAVGRELRVYNWTDYIDPDLIAEFTEQTGIEVIYDTFDSNEVLLAKTLAGNSGYDLVVPSEYTVAYMVQAQKLLAIDQSKIPNYKNVWPFVLERLEEIDGLNDYSVPYLWGTTGIAYDQNKINALIPDAPKDSMALLFDPTYAEKLAQCGIYMLDSPSEVFPMVNMYLGNPAESTEKAHMDQAIAVLEKIRPFVKKFHSSEYINVMANGDACLSLGWSGDLYLAKARAIEAKTGADITYFIPKEGALIWFDQFAILKDAPNIDEAYTFINFLLDAKNNARSADFVEYATANEAAFAFVNQDLRNDLTLYPSDADLRKLHVKKPYTQAEQKKLMRAWINIKSK